MPGEEETVVLRDYTPIGSFVRRSKKDYVFQSKDKKPLPKVIKAELQEAIDHIDKNPDYHPSVKKFYEWKHSNNQK